MSKRANGNQHSDKPMVKLVYRTADFGDINLEYNKPRITLGSSRDCDLVLLHPEVRPVHCEIEFFENGLRLHPAAQDAASGNVPADLPVGDYLVGDVLALGGSLRFAIELSENTVAIPMGSLAQRSQETFAREPDEPLYVCPGCRLEIPLHEVKTIGLKGHQQHMLCPRCSQPVAPVVAAEDAAGRKKGGFDVFKTKLREFWYGKGSKRAKGHRG